MRYVTFPTTPKLAPYVRFFWVLESDLSQGEEFVHRSVADGGVEIVFHYRGTFNDLCDAGSSELSPLSNIQAQSTGFRRFATNTSFGIFGAYLYPFAIPRLFAMPAADFTNLSPDLYSVFGMEGKLLEEQMCTAADNEKRVSIISSYLESKLDANKRDLPAVHTAVHTIINAGGLITVEDLAKYFDLSTRQFERRFKEFAGLGPKLYANVIRFQTATAQRSAGIRDLTEIAYRCGYYDQSHFINDFRRFSGYSPKEYFWNQAEGTQYMDA